jgi:5-formyltetrahydrofolate cyclo-ligase
MMKGSFEPRERVRAIGPGACFFLLIALGWTLSFWLTENSPVKTADAGLLQALVQGGFLQSLLLALICTGACAWLYIKGAPLWICAAVAAISALFVSFLHQMGQPDKDVMVVACLIPLTLGLIVAVQDNCAALRKAISAAVLFILLTIPLLVDLSMVAVVIPTLIVLCLTPTRVKGRLALCALATAALWAILLLVVLPYLGWTGSTLVFSAAARIVRNLTDISFLLTVPSAILLAMESATLVVLAWVLTTRRPRYLLPFVPLLAFGLLRLLSGPQQGGELGLLAGAFALCVSFLILIPFMREYSETKEALRRRFLALRAKIAEGERDQRSERACVLLLEQIQKLSPDAGYIGLYLARGSELSLNPLAVQLGAIGYRIAYPIMLPDSRIAFSTTLGVSDEALFASLLEDDPFDTEVSEKPIPLTRIEPSELSVLVVPGIAFDRDRHRLGRGTGRYDRYIACLEEGAPVWGVGFMEQLAEAIPVERHDLPLSGVVLG